MAKLAGAMAKAQEDLFGHFAFLSELQLGVEGIDARIRAAREDITRVEAAAAAAEGAAQAARKVPPAADAAGHSRSQHADLRGEGCGEGCSTFSSIFLTVAAGVCGSCRDCHHAL